MRNKPLFAFVVCMALLFVNLPLVAQDYFRKGYVVTLAQDTLQGMIQERSLEENYQSCIFKKDREVKTYLPDGLLGYGFNDGSYFSAQMKQDAFVEVIVLGDISLYHYKNTFLLKKNEEVVTITENPEKIALNEEERDIDRYEWKRDISRLVRDRITDYNEQLLHLSPTRRNLTNLVIRYNKQEASLYSLYATNQPIPDVKFGFMLGLNRFQLNAGGNFWGYPYLNQSYESYLPSVGVMVKVSFPRFSEKISFQGEMHYDREDYTYFYQQEENGVLNYHDVYMHFSKLSFPLSMKYRIPLGRYSLSIQGGVNFDRYGTVDTRLLSESVAGSEVTRAPEREVLPYFETLQTGYWGGLEFGRTFTKFEGAIAVRYFKMPRFYELPSITISNNRISINLILTQK